jgi:CPA1 family monovalent cation:H+ antiporter
MQHNPLLATEIDIIVLLLVACLTAIALTRFQFPYTVGLVVIGIGLGILGKTVESLEFLPTLTLSHDLILFIFVPPLIFESAINLNSRLLFRNLIPILTLAAPGLLLSTAIVGTILHWGTPLPLAQALLFGSLISATDPVAVIALFKELGAPKQLAVLVEGESLFNDATAIVLFNIILGLILADSGFEFATVQQGTINFLINFAGGIAVGGVIGLLAQYLMTLIRDNSLVLATISTIVAYSAFLIADEAFAVSGVIAVVTAGLIVGWFRSNRLKPEAREFFEEFWEYVAFLANSLIFLLVGLTIVDFQFFGELGQTQSLPVWMALTIGAVLLARAIVVFGLIPLLNLFRRGATIERRYQLVSYWGGLRGAVCLALALSLAPDFPNRDLIVILTLGVAIFTLLIPGTTISPLMQWLKLDRPSEVDQFDEIVAQIFATQEALEQASMLEATFYNSQPEVIAAYRESYTQETQRKRQALIQRWTAANPDEATTQELVWLEALAIEQRMYRQLYDRGFLSETMLSQFTLMANLKQDAVLTGEIPPPLPTAPRSLEVKGLQLALNLGEKLAPESSWVAQLKQYRNFATIEFWAVTSYVGRVLPNRLREFFTLSGLDLTIIEPCIAAYEQQRNLAISRVEQLEQENPGVLANYQTQISDRVGILAQQEAIEGLADAGNITESVASKLLQALEVA